MASASGTDATVPLEGLSLGGDDVRRKNDKNTKHEHLQEDSAEEDGGGNDHYDHDNVHDDDDDDEQEKTKPIQHNVAAGTKTTTFATIQQSEIDLESALHQVMWNDASDKEFLSADSWITFRVGHAGDASTIASLFRSTSPSFSSSSVSSSLEGGVGGKVVTADDGKSSKKLNDDTDDSLELRLSAGLGDEDTPPAVFCVFADVSTNIHSDDDNDDDDSSKGEVSGNTTFTQIGAVALFSLDGELGTRLLRIEWFHVDETIREHDLVKRRLCFRLSALALATGCQLLLPPSSAAEC